MNDRIHNALIAVLAVVAVSLAAATLSSTVAPGDSASGSGLGSGSGEGGGLPVAGGSPPPADPISQPAIPYVREVLTALFVLAALLALYYLLGGRGGVRAFALVLAVVVIASLLALWFASSGAFTPANASAPNGSLLGGGGGEQRSSAEPLSTPVPVVLLVLLGVLAVVAAAFWVHAARSSTTELGSGDADSNSASPAAIAGAAGRAADRIERPAENENEIYRAWREMTGLLDVSRPETATPETFAAAAVDSGLRREDVTELTRLFEDVRYGRTDPSSRNERRAIDVFRRIERTYAEGETNDGSEGDEGEGT